jgi:predicted nucleotidyltransferase
MDNLTLELKSSNKIIRSKIQKSLDIIQLLYRNNLITDAYIVGPVAERTANQYSDIDINIINPLFEIQNIIELRPIETSPIIKKVIDHLKDIGVKFKIIKRKNLEIWYQLYRSELFHILLVKDEKYTIKPRIHIARDASDNLILRV